MPTEELFSNNPATTVTSGGTTTPAGGTSETWTVTSSSSFPAANSSAIPPTQFHVADPAFPAEIIAVTNVSGNTWTVTRGAEGTAPLSHLAGFTVEQVVSAGVFGSFITTQQPASGDLSGSYPNPSVVKVNGVSVSGTPAAGQVLMATSATASAWQALPAAALNYRGQVQYSTTYNPGDVILYNGERVYITSTAVTGSGTNGIGMPFISAANYVALSSFGIYYASDYGVKADGSTDDWASLQALLILLRSLTTNSFNGFRVILPTGISMLSKTLVIPTQTMLEGQGLYSTTLKIMSGANCDVVQPEQFNSSAQAALLTTLQPSLTAGNLHNAFRWGIRNLTIHGNSGQQAPGGYHMCLNVATNPLLTTTGSDPDFDPAGIVENVQFRAASGDGLFHNGRSALRLIGCIAWFNNGNGFSPSFDTQIDHCQAGFSGIAGFYFNHGADQGAGNKSYNNGSAAQWVSGSNYSAGARVVYNGLPYDAINSLTNDTVVPSSDATNWAPVSATSPAAWGSGVYMDSNSGEITFNCDCQENSAHNWYFHGCVGTGIFVSGVSTQPNYNYSGSTLNTTNPNNYAHVCVDGSNGVQAAIACGDNPGHTATQFRLRIVNGSTRNDLTLTGDTNATFLTPDSFTLLGSGNSVRYNGTSLTSTLTAQNDVSVSSPSNQQVLSYNTTTSKWQNSSLGNNYLGVFGDGSDGAATLDGTTTYAAFSSLSGSTYTLTRDTFLTSLTINSGATLNTAGFRIFCTSQFTSNGTIATAGNAGTASGTAGAALSNTTLGTYAGGAGNTGAGSAGAGGSIGTANGGAGGSGGSGAAGAAGFCSSTATWMLRSPSYALSGLSVFNGILRAFGGSSGGGGGGGDGTNKGGGGGAGAPGIVVFAHSFTNTGTISATGGLGGTPTTGNCGGGGGGGGGMILVFTLGSAWSNTGTTSSPGGTAGSGVGAGSAGTNGVNGPAALNVVLQ